MDIDETVEEGEEEYFCIALPIDEGESEEGVAYCIPVFPILNAELDEE